MTKAPATADGDRPRVGRPPRISRQAIAEAGHELGLDGLTLRAVADHLGVSIAALYHHVEGKDDLMRLAAEHSASKVPRPVDRGQHWAVWLLEWAEYNRDAFLAEPGLLAQYLDGAISAESIAANVDAILGALVRQGFDVVEANAAYNLTSTCAVGTAVNVIRERQATEAGRSTPREYREVLSGHGDDALPHLRALVDAYSTGTPPPDFREQITAVIAGIAVRKGDDPAEVISHLADA